MATTESILDAAFGKPNGGWHDMRKNFDWAGALLSAATRIFWPRRNTGACHTATAPAGPSAEEGRLGVGCRTASNAATHSAPPCTAANTHRPTPSYRGEMRSPVRVGRGSGGRRKKLQGRS